MVGCAAYGCVNRSDRNRLKGGVTFHMFPKDPRRRAKWVRAVGRKDWEPTNWSVLCSEHFRPEEVNRTSASSVRLREGSVPSLFPGFPTCIQGRRRKQLKTDDEAVIDYIESLEALKQTPECVICCRPLDDKKANLSTPTTTTGLSLYQCLLGLSRDQPSNINHCTISDSVCHYCAHLINYADKIEAELARLKVAINGCLHIKSMREDDQVMQQQEFNSHVAILDEFSERVVGPGSAAARNAALSENADNGTTDKVMEGIITALDTLESSQDERIIRKSVWTNKSKGKVKTDKVQKPQASATSQYDPPVLRCKICNLRTTSSAVLLFHLRRHMANYQWCDFCDTPIFDDESEILELNKHSAARL